MERYFVCLFGGRMPDKCHSIGSRVRSQWTEHWKKTMFWMIAQYLWSCFTWLKAEWFGSLSARLNAFERLIPYIRLSYRIKSHNSVSFFSIPLWMSTRKASSFVSALKHNIKARKWLSLYFLYITLDFYLDPTFAGFQLGFRLGFQSHR